MLISKSLLGVDNWCLALEFTVSILSCKIFTLAHCFFQVLFLLLLEQKFLVAHCQRVRFLSQRFQVRILEFSECKERRFCVVFLDSKGPTGRRQVSQILSDSPIAFHGSSMGSTTTPLCTRFRRGPQQRSPCLTSRPLLYYE